MRKALLTSFVSAAMVASIASAADYEGSFDRTLHVSGTVDLDAMTDSGGITIRTGSDGAVHIHGILKAQHGWVSSGNVEERIHELERNPPIEQTGNSVRVGHVADPSLLRNISMRLEIETPSDTRVRARADSGGIRVSGVRGSTDCRTDSGGIDVRDIGAEVRATADSGGIRVSDIAGPLYARVDSGGIEAENVAGSVDVQTDSGGIRVSQSKAAPIHAKADSGGVTLHLAPNAGYDARLDS